MKDHADIQEIWALLDEVKDPEIPAVSVVEMGMIRTIGWAGDKVIVTFSPTFAGCPALQVIQEAIKASLNRYGYSEVQIQVNLSTPWSSNWISPSGREKLRMFGLAPPPLHKGDIEKAFNQPAVCPYCASTDTELESDFGSTLCRAIYICRDCRQPFEQFKPV